MRRIIIAAVLLAAPVLAQQQPANPKTTRLVTLKYIEPRTIQDVVGAFGVNTTINPQLKLLTLYGTEANIAAAEAVIKQFDVPPKTIDLSVYFVVGGDDPKLLAGTAVPADIRDVITQLKNTLAFKEYRVMDVLTLRTETGASAETSGIVNSGSPPRMSQLSIRNVTVEDGAIRLERLHAGLRIPYQSEKDKMNYMNTGIDQNVSVKEGQKVVVGRSSLDGPEKAMILILTAKVVQ